MPNLDRVTQRTRQIRFRPRAMLQFRIVFLARAERPRRVSRGSISKKLRKRSAFQPKFGGNCQRIGPNFSRNASTPEAKKLASGVSTSRSFFICVMKRGPFTLKMKPAGVSANQR